MTTTSASSGPEALQKLSENSFDVVLLDLQMPGMDGITLAREIRKRSPVPLVLLSSIGEVQVGEIAGLFQFEIPKPIKQSLLFDALLQITGAVNHRRPKTGRKQFDGDMGARQPLRILLAEDNAINQKVVLMMLARLGYQADVATNGREALEAAVRTTYDLILMDVQMPEMGGVEATSLLGQKLGVKCPCIVALTAEALEGDRARLLGLGFDGYLSKPLQASALQDLLKAIKSSQLQANGSIA